MRIRWSKKAENSFSRIVEHIVQNFSFERGQEVYGAINMISSRLAVYPELGRKIGNHFHKRYLIIFGNVLIYQIVLGANPEILILNIKPRKTE